MFSKSGKRVVILNIIKNKGLRIFSFDPFKKLYNYLNYLLVPELGIEPRCPCERGILSHN